MHITLILIAAMAVADRWCGGGLGWKRLAHDHGGPLRGRPNYYAIPLLLALGWFVDHTTGVFVAAAWQVYRGAVGFPTDTLTGRDRPATWERHALALLAAVIMALRGLSLDHAPPAVFAVIAPFLLYVGAAVVLAKWNGDRVLKLPEHKRVNITGLVETLRGGLFGLAWAVSLALQRGLG